MADLIPCALTQHTVYTPAQRPGFVAWAAAYSFGDGSVGLSFDETLRQPNPAFCVPKLEFAEVTGTPVSYCSVEGGSADQTTFRVHMRSRDGIHFEETGRCLRDSGTFCCVGFPDGSLIGYNVSHRNKEGTGWEECIQVRQSRDGGSTWQPICTLFPGTAPYIWRARRLRDGTIILLASFYGTPWGIGHTRPTRNTMLPGETYQSKIQTFFVTSTDGIHYSTPQYILPGIGAHEYDVVELEDGRLLFVAGDVQGTPVGRQILTPSADGWINAGLLPIFAGAPQDPQKDPQGGFIPETMVWDAKNRLILGYRRNKGFSVSNDLGENWVKLTPDTPYTMLYQPFMIPLSDGSIAMYGHVGGDSAFGQQDMTIQAQRIDPSPAAGLLPRAVTLTLERLLSQDGSHYVNGFQTRVVCDGQPLPDQPVEFRFNHFWKDDGAVNTTAQADAPVKLTAVTDADGYAQVYARCFDHLADIHLAYNVDVVCPGSPTVRPCSGPMMTVLALTPYRRQLYPRDAYFAGGVLYLSPGFLQDFPQAIPMLKESISGSDRFYPCALTEDAVLRLKEAGVLTTGEDGVLRWIPSVHAARPLDDVKPMASGDWYE